MSQNNKKGFSLIELMVVLAIIGLLLGMLMPALASSRAQTRLLVDGAQIRGIHQAWLVYAGSSEGSFPVPGLMSRLRISTENGNQYVPGRGDENIAKNVHQDLYSACIMLNYFSPEQCVGPTEPSGQVFVHDAYDWDLYNPIENMYWDDSFVADLNLESNLSYAQMPMGDARRVREWRDSANSRFVVLGNRGMKYGRHDSETYHNSLALQIHGGPKQWVGNVAFNDNHVEVLRSIIPEGLTYRSDGEMRPDNLFSNETSSATSNKGHDIWLCVMTNFLGIECNTGRELWYTSWD